MRVLSSWNRRKSLLEGLGLEVVTPEVYFREAWSPLLWGPALTILMEIQQNLHLSSTKQ